jgi:large subunit ribosomal protein L25
MAKDQKTIELVVQQRERARKGGKKLRRQHILPAVVYGHKVDPVSVAVDQQEAERLYHRAGNTTLIDLKIGDTGKAQKVFIHEVQRSPTTHALTHIDFMVVNLLEEITTTVPLVLVGEAPGIGSEAMLMHPLDHLQVRALPMDLPPNVEVDVSGLEEVDQAIYVSDITPPENVHILNSPDELIAKLSAIRVTAEEEEAEEEAAEAAEGEEGAEEGGAEAETEEES